MQSKAYKLAISVSYKQDLWNLLEFIEYHRLVGVQHIYICNNDEKIDTTNEILLPYIEDGFVDNIHTAKRWPHGRHINRQAIAHNFILNRYRKDVQWLAMLDMDEFIFPLQANNVLEVLKDYESYPAIALNYACFGSSGLSHKPFLQTEAYKYRAEDSWGWNRLTKSIGQTDKCVRCPHHHHFGIQKRFGSMIGENKKPCGWLRKFSGNILRINHYMARSKEDFEEKMRRGNPFGEKRDWRWFAWADRNEQYDFGMDRFVPQLKENLMARRNLLVKSRRKIFFI
jgi:hypothetical protein